jgi:hypothetical protein
MPKPLRGNRITQLLNTTVTNSLQSRDLVFGALARPIHDQLHPGHFGMKHRYSILQANADAITRLAVHQLLTEAEVRRARLRLLKDIRRKFLSTLKSQFRRRR